MTTLYIIGLCICCVVGGLTVGCSIFAILNFIDCDKLISKSKKLDEKIKHLDEPREKPNCYLTDKGLAVTAAVESGLLPRVDGGWDDTKFNEFWQRYEELLMTSRKQGHD